MSDTPRPPEDAPRETITERLDRFRKNVDPERLTPLLAGSASGFIAGTVATALMFTINGHAPLHPQSVPLIITLTATSITLFLHTLNKTQTPKHRPHPPNTPKKTNQPQPP